MTHKIKARQNSKKRRSSKLPAKKQSRPQGSDDYIDPDVLELEMRKKLRRDAGDHAAFISVRATIISKEHEFDFSDVRPLLSQLWALKSDPPGTNFDPNNWHAPSDLSSWKEARKILKKFSQHLERGNDLLSSSYNKEIVLHALAEACDRAAQLEGREKPQYSINHLWRSVSDLQKIAADAASWEGRKGRKQLPDWKYEAAELCKSFWRKHRGEEPKPYFNDAKREEGEPANMFSRWFCDVMFELHDMPTKQCITLLRG